MIYDELIHLLDSSLTWLSFIQIASVLEEELEISKCNMEYTF